MTKARNVVIAMDESEYSSYAFDWYVKTVRKPTDYVIIVHSPDHHHSLLHTHKGNIPKLTQELSEGEKKTKNLLANFKDRLNKNKIEGHVVSDHGDPGDLVLRVADKEDAKCIVMGSRGSGVVRRTLVGSVSDYVMSHSDVPVLVCRHKDHHHHHHHM